MKKIAFYSILLIIVLASCNKDIINKDKNAKLKFSSSIITFDTIFTGVSSITQRLMIYNPYNTNLITDIFYLEIKILILVLMSMVYQQQN